MEGDENGLLKLELFFLKEFNKKSEDDVDSMEIILYKTEEEYYLRFMRKEISKYDFIEKYEKISELVLNLI